VLVVGFSAPVFAGIPLPVCEHDLEISALRGGSGSALSGGTKDITSKARIVKGTAPIDATLNDTALSENVAYRTRFLRNQRHAAQTGE
jgi:hypothetical protein